MSAKFWVGPVWILRSKGTKDVTFFYDLGLFKYLWEPDLKSTFKLSQSISVSLLKAMVVAFYLVLMDRSGEYNWYGRQHKSKLIRINHFDFSKKLLLIFSNIFTKSNCDYRIHANIMTLLIKRPWDTLWAYFDHFWLKVVKTIFEQEFIKNDHFAVSKI